ncbi:MAG TPA: BatD family protein [Gemmatimonadales bacterium]|nr:BatD family protein [Gemmatimonadales bacterium]
MTAGLWSAVLVALLAAGVQGNGPQLEATVDADQVSVGEELTYTLRAVSHSQLPMQVTVVPFNGLEIVSRTERSEVSIGADPTRTTVLAVRLRAARPGRWQLGPARAVQGRDTVEAAALIVDVTANRAATAPTLNPRLRRLLDQATPPASGEASVDLIVSTDTARVGEQVDVVTAAWFPRDLRLQLRRPPTLQPPVIDGVWTYPQATPSGIAATRNMGGRWYDLFVAHQVVFPLVAGPVVIPPATLKYSTPVALQFFSQEERFALTSPAETLAVRALPAAGRPAEFTGAVGAGLRLERRVNPQSARAGEGVTVELELTGQGNTALWPAPELAWAAGARAYADRVEERVSAIDGRVGGTKVFRYLVVPDSAGALALPPVRYAYFDLAAGRYLSVTVPAGSVPVAPAAAAATAAALPPPLLRGSGPSLARRIAGGVPDWLWAVLLLLPPVVLGPWSRPRLRARPPAGGTGGDLQGADEELEALVVALVPDPDRRSGARLAAAVRAAGADTELSARVAEVREALLARRYGPDAGRPDDPALAAEARELARRLGGSLRGWSARGTAALWLASVLTGAATAQAPSPEALYADGSLAVAAEGFSRRAALEPADPAHWYNLGAAHYRQGQEGRAAAAWLQARRLAPRADAVRQAMRLTPPPDAASSRWTWTPPMTPEELLLVGTIGWLAGWLGWARVPRMRERWLVLLVFAACAAGAGLALRVWYRQPLAIVLDRTTVRISPHGLAPAVGPLEPGAAVRVLRRDRGWVLVRLPGERRGWVADAAVARVGG